MSSAVAERFDVYQEWLGIDPSEQPPTYYRLLELPPFSADMAVIVQAAQRQRERLLSNRSAEFGAERMSLLAEIDRAQDCLTDPAAKRAYDQQLRRASLLMPETKDAYRQRLDLQAAGRAGAMPQVSWQRGPAVTSPADISAPPPLPGLRPRSEPREGAGGPIPSHPNFEIFQEIGRGSSAVVYEAYDRSLQRYVAIKQLDERFRDDKRQSELFWNEARFLAAQSHDNIVQVYAVDESRGWIIMELMSGSLAAQSDNGKLSADVVRSVLRQALEGLRFLHKRGRIHGEIKPASLLIDDEGRIKLSDSPGFSVGGEFRMPKASQKHIAPELLSPDVFGPVGAAVDLYCLGFTAFELLKGPGFDGLFKGVGGDQDAGNIAWMRWHGSPTETLPRVKDVLPEVPDDVAAVIDRMLQKKVADRYASADEALRDLQDRPILLLDVADPKNAKGASAAPGEPPPWERLRSQPYFPSQGLVADGPERPLTERLRDPAWLKQAWSNRRVQWSALGVVFLLAVFVVATSGRSRGAAPSSRPVVIGSEPAGAQIVIDGKATDKQTPTQVIVPVGVHRLELVLPDYAPFSTGIEITPGRDPQRLDTFTLTPDLDPLVRIDSQPPGADVAVDGAMIGQETPAELRLPAGRYQVRLTKEGFRPLSTEIVILAGAELQTFTENPLVPERAAESDEESERNRRAPRGERTAGSDAADRPGTAETRDEPPSPREYQLILRSTPAGAAVFIDGEAREVETPVAVSVTPGRYRVELRLPEYEPYTETVTVRDRDVRIVADWAARPPQPMQDADGPTPPRPVWTVARDGWELQEYVRNVELMLTEDWFLEPAAGLKEAERHFEAARRIASRDPRLYYVYGLLLRRHYRPDAAVPQFEESVRLERERIAAAKDRERYLPNYGAWRQLVQVRIGLRQYERAAADAMDLVRVSADAMPNAESSLWSAQAEAALVDNARFVGMVFAFLRGPAEVETRARIPFREYEVQMAAVLSSASTSSAWREGRDELARLYESELEIAARRDEEREAREERLQESGELATSEIEAKRKGKSLDRMESLEDRGPIYSQLLIGNSQLPFSTELRGPELLDENKVWTEYETERTTRLTVKEKLPAPALRRPYALSTYLPTGLEDERRMLLDSLPRAS